MLTPLGSCIYEHLLLLHDMHRRNFLSLSLGISTETAEWETQPQSSMDDEEQGRHGITSVSQSGWKESFLELILPRGERTKSAESGALIVDIKKDKRRRRRKKIEHGGLTARRVTKWLCPRFSIFFFFFGNDYSCYSFDACSTARNAQQQHHRLHPEHTRNLLFTRERVERIIFILLLFLFSGRGK